MVETPRSGVSFHGNGRAGGDGDDSACGLGGVAQAMIYAHGPVLRFYMGPFLPPLAWALGAASEQIPREPLRGSSE